MKRLRRIYSCPRPSFSFLRFWKFCQTTKNDQLVENPENYENEQNNISNIIPINEFIQTYKVSFYCYIWVDQNDANFNGSVLSIEGEGREAAFL